jgi:hypothetical protein
MTFARKFAWDGAWALDPQSPPSIPRPKNAPLSDSNFPPLAVVSAFFSPDDPAHLTRKGIRDISSFFHGGLSAQVKLY